MRKFKTQSFKLKYFCVCLVIKSQARMRISTEVSKVVQCSCLLCDFSEVIVL